MDRLPMPAAMPVEIAERLSDAADRKLEEPDFAQVEDYAGIVTKELHDPLSDLFSTRDEIRRLQRSDAFKDVLNHQKAVEWLLNDLAKLELALKHLWESA